MDMPTPPDTEITAAPDSGKRQRAVAWLESHKRTVIGGGGIVAALLISLSALFLLFRDMPSGQSWSIGASQEVTPLGSTDIANLDKRLLTLKAGSPGFSSQADAHLKLLATLKLIDGRGGINLDRHLYRFIGAMRQAVETPDAALGFQYAEQAFNLMDDPSIRQSAARKLGFLSMAKQIPGPERLERLFRIWASVDRTCVQPNSHCDRLTQDFALYFAAHATLSPDAQQTAFLLTRRIGNARQRTIAYREVGIIMTRPLLGDRSDAALGTFVEIALKAKQPKSALAAAAASTIKAGNDRDILLRAVEERLLDKGNVLDALDAGSALSDPVSRDAALLRVVNVGSAKGYIHEAQVAERAIEGSDTRTMARALIGLALAKAGYAAQAQPYTQDLVPAIAAMPDGPTRHVAAAYGVQVMAAIDDIDGAKRLLDLATFDGAVRDSALLAVASDYSSVRNADGIAELGAEAKGALAGELLGRAAAIAARAGDPGRAEKIVASASSDQAWLRAAGRLALSADMPATWLAEARSRFATISTRDPALWDELSFADAALFAASSKLDLAARRLAFIGDSRLRAEVAKRIAVGMARKGDYDAAIGLIAQIASSHPEDRDMLKAAISLELGKVGAIRLAAYTARGITDTAVRVHTFHALARAQANTLDRFSALKGQPQPDTPFFDRTARPDPAVERYIYTTYNVRQNKLGDFLPRLPDSDRYDAAAVRRLVPQSDGTGALDIVPLVNNDYNKKFLTARSVQDDWTLVGATIVMAAQGTRHPVYLHLSRGRLSLPQLWEQLVMRGQGRFLQRDGRVYTLRVPIFVSEGSTLTLSGSDVDSLRMSTQHAAFLVNAGEMHISDVTLVGWDEADNAPTPMTYETRHAFRPFYIAWSNSLTRAVGSKFLNLGYASGKAYGMTLTYGPVTLLQRNVEQVRPPTGTFVENSFDNMLYGFYSYEANDVQVVGNEYRNNIVYGIDPHDRSHRLLFSYNTVYGSHKKHGIIGSRNVEDSWVIGNLTFDNKGSGIMMDRYAGRNIIYANTAFDNHSNGISIYESPCNIISSNSMFKNGRSGITVRNSWDVGVFHNVADDNGNLGLEGYSVEFVTKPGAPERNLLLDPYEQYLSLSAASNRLKNNKQGAMGMTGMGATLLQGNTLIGSSKRSFLNDLKLAERDIGSRQANGVMIGGGCPKPKRPYACPFLQQNYLSQELASAPLAGRPFPSCPGRTIVNAATKQRAPVLPSEMREDDEEAITGLSAAGAKL